MSDNILGKITYFLPESAFVPSSHGSCELVEKKDLHIVTDAQSGNIAHIGDPRDMQDWLNTQKQINPSLIVEKVEGGIALPGTTDAHHHLLYGTLDIIQCGYVFGVISHNELAEIIRNQIQDGNNPEIPKLFLGHNTAAVPNFFRDQIDEVSGTRAVALIDLSLHGARLNSKMMRLVAERAAKEMSCGNIMSGYLNMQNGQATESYALQAIQIAETHYGVEKIAEGMTRRLDQWSRQGITDVHDMYPLSFDDVKATLMARKAWEKERGTRFPVRQIFMIPELLDNLLSSQFELEKDGLFDPNNDWDMIGVKLLGDGSFGSHTALVGKPYHGKNSQGIEFHSDEEISNALKLIQQSGINRIAMHAIGDRAVERALDTARQWVYLAEKAKIDPTRFRIEHFELGGEMLDEVKALGVWVCSQPNFLTDYIYKDRLQDRVNQICPHSDVIEKGIPMHFGSDGMPTSALFGVWAATHHYNPSQQITFEQALAAYSLMGANYEYNKNRGRITTGASADLVITSRDTIEELLPGEVSPEEFESLGNDSVKLSNKVTELESGIKFVYRQGRLLR